MTLLVKYWCLIICLSIVKATDYCRQDLCIYEGAHIGCGNNNKISGECASYSQMENLSSFKKDIVDAHNKYRSQIASGNVSGFKPAVRMATMEWDHELEHLAGLNVKTCKFNHDRCRNTDEFKHSGQNLAYWWGYPDQGIKKIFLNGIKDWFDEYKDTNMNVIDRFSMGNSRKQYGHFTVMVADNNNKLGCAAIRKIQGEAVEYVMACNYARTNIMSRRIYKSGTSAAECKTGKNPKYPGLCSVNEMIDPNDI